jgi:sugar diacid utilization regulator
VPLGAAKGMAGGVPLGATKGMAGGVPVGVAGIAALAAENRRLADAISDLERQQQARETLTSVVAAGAGVEGVATALHAATALPVAVEDQFGCPLAWAGPGRPEPGPPQPQRRHVALVAGDAPRRGPVRIHDRWVARATQWNEVLGAIALVDPAQRAGRHELLALQHAAVLLAVQLGHQRELAATELRLGGDLVTDLLTGVQTSTARSRATALGHDLRGEHQVLVVRWHGVRSGDDATRAVERAARRCDIDALTAHRAGLIVLVAARPAGWARQHHWGRFHQALTECLRPATGYVGVGGVCSAPSDLPRSYGEALHSLAIRERCQVPGLTTFDELGVLRLLFTGEDDTDVEQFVRDWLGPLIDYDGARGTDLVPTLSQYYESGGNYDATAAALHVHRSTLRYRIKRIRELTGHDLGAVDCRLNLQVATRAWQVLSGLA